MTTLTASQCSAAAAHSAETVAQEAVLPTEAGMTAGSCVSEMSFCDLADSVAPSDSVSQLASPRNMIFTGFSASSAGPVDDAFTAWKMDCVRKENLSRMHSQQEKLLGRLQQDQAPGPEENEEDFSNDVHCDMAMTQLVQSMRNIERSVANLHIHFGTAFPPSRGPRNRRTSAGLSAGNISDSPQSFHCNTNINAPNMNRQHATGGRGRGRRHANLG